MNSRRWLPRMSSYGLVLIDCVARRGGNLGVSELWEELKARYKSFTFDHGPGLGVLAVGVDAARVIESLVKADAEEIARIRRFFAAVGRMQRERITTLHALAPGPSRLLIQTGLQAERIERLTSALRDSRRQLAAAAERLAICDERSASLTWRIVDRVSHRIARFAPRGGKRRTFIHAGLRALRAGARLRKPQYIRGLLTSLAQRARQAPPGKIAGMVCDSFRVALEFIRFRWEVRVKPPNIPQFDSVDASIIIPDADQTVNMLACLKSIAGNVPGLTFEVIAVKECSTRAMLRAFGKIPGLVAVANPQKTGFGESCNRGAAVAKGEYLVFLESTATVTEGWLASLAQTFQDLPGVGLVVPKRLDPDGRLKDAAISIGADATGRCKSDDPEHPRHNFVRELDSCSPACMMIKRALFNQIDGFGCEHNGGENTTAGLVQRIRRAGYKVVYQPLARILHEEGRAHGQAATPAISSIRAINQPHFRGNLSKPGEAFARVISPGPAQSDGEPSPALKGRVLVIDYSLPTPDQDAGSFRMMEILKAIRAGGKQVTFIPADLVHRSPYAQNLQRIGIEVVHQPFYQSVLYYLEEHGREFDLVILSRADVASRFVEPVRMCAPLAKVVFDTVDLHFLREARAAELLNDARLRNAARRRKRQELVLATQCDATVVVSPVEKAILENECPGLLVHLLPTIMEIPRESPPAFEDRQSILFIGGFAHPPNVDAVVNFVEEILPLVVARLPDVVFVVVGSNTPDEVRNLGGKNVQVLGFVQNVKPILDQARVAVAPLRFGAGVKGKVNQSMAHGIPTVVSSIAAEGMHLVHEDNAMIADDPASFASAIVGLYTSKELWERISANGRENVREHFSVESARRRIDELLAFAALDARRPSQLADLWTAMET